MSKFFCNGADAECNCPILCADCSSADWTGGTEIKTNADHIRSMTEEELVYLLHDYYCEGHADGLHHIYDAMPISDVREWLKQPYKEDT